MRNFTAHVTQVSPAHVRFSIFDVERGLCGNLCIRRADLALFLRYGWNGNVNWNNQLTDELCAELRAASVPMQVPTFANGGDKDD